MVLSLLSLSWILFSTLGPSQIIEVNLGLGDHIDVDAFDHEPSLQSFLQSINTNELNQISYRYTRDLIEYTVDVTISNAYTALHPLIGEELFIASFSLMSTNQWIELFNPTLTDQSLDDYRLMVNDLLYAFALKSSIAPLSNLIIPLIQTTPTDQPISSTQALHYVDDIAQLQLVRMDDANSPLILDDIIVADTITTAYRTLPLDQAYFRRHPRTTGPSPEFDGLQWRGFLDDIPFNNFTIAEPQVDALTQAKAWATDVMFGRGMFAAGRVEEAFRTIESEYGFMDPLSQALLFSAPNTVIQGLNEQGQNDQSTFREAIGRYNYLAARVPGATGLSMPNATPWITTNIILIAIGISGLVAIILMIKLIQTKKHT
jgi:hypothetical protein